MAERSWVFEPGILYANEPEDEVPVLSPRIPAEFNELGPERIDLLAQAMAPTGCSVIAARFAGRRRCFGACVNGRVAAYGWVSLSAECIGEQERMIELGPREAYVWDCATLKDYRRLGLYAALLSHIVAILRTEGVRRIWIGSSVDNRPSRRGFVKAGFRPALTVVYGRAGSLRFLLSYGAGSAPAQLVADTQRALSIDQERTLGPVTVTRVRPSLSPPCSEMEF